MKFNNLESGSYRLFVGIFPPEEYFDYFAKVIKSFDKQKRNLRNLPVDQMHVTLKFIGANVGEDSKNLLIDAFKRYEGQFSKPEINISKIQFGFPHQTDPRIIMAKVDNNEELDTLADEVHLVVRSLRRRDTIRWKEKKAKDFHISITRLKEAATRSSGKEISKIAKVLRMEHPEPFKPTEMFLMQSIISPGSVAYKKLASIKL